MTTKGTMETLENVGNCIGAGVIVGGLLVVEDIKQAKGFTATTCAVLRAPIMGMFGGLIGALALNGVRQYNPVVEDFGAVI